MTFGWPSDDLRMTSERPLDGVGPHLEDGLLGEAGGRSEDCAIGRAQKLEWIRVIA